MKRLLAVINLCLLLSLVMPIGTDAQGLDDIIDKKDLAIDLSLIEDSGDYTQPRTILITPVFMETANDIEFREWYRGLFYYFGSDRYLFKDIPAHYIMDGNGKVYEGIKGGVEKKIIVKQQTRSPILIFYLARRGDTDFTLSAKSELRDFLLKLANENEIKPTEMEVAGIKLVIDQEKREASLTKDPIFGSWNLSMKTLKETLTPLYRPTQKNYQVDVAQYENPKAKVKVGSQVVLNIKLKNIGAYTIFPESDSELLLTKKDGSDSQFFLNDQWVSKTQVPILTSGDIFLPGEEKTFDIKVNVPFEPGTYAEKFIIKTAGGATIKNSDIEVKLNIDRGDLKILEILPTETGTLNIRQNGASGSPVVDKASPGQRYIWLRRSDVGWYEIQLDDGTGWILARYAKEL